MLSAGSPVAGSVIATRLRHVSFAHVRTRALSRDATAPALRMNAGACRGAVDDAEAEPGGDRAKAATEAAPPTRRARRVGRWIWSDMGCAPFRFRFTLASVTGHGCAARHRTARVT